VALLLAASLGLAAGCQTRPAKKKTPIQLSLDALEKAGVKAYEEGRYGSATRLFRESEALARSTDNLVALANAYNNLGATMKEMGETEKASALLTDALRLNEALNLDHARAVNLANLASLEIDRKKADLSRARAFNRRARSLFREAGNEVGSLHVRNNEGRILLHQGRHQEALKVFDEALSDADGQEAARLRAVLLSNRGRAYEEMADLVNALRDYEAALSLDREPRSRGPGPNQARREGGVRQDLAPSPRRGAPAGPLGALDPPRPGGHGKAPFGTGPAERGQKPSQACGGGDRTGEAGGGALGQGADGQAYGGPLGIPVVP
jgi:Tfp pilus assembly protein PilF